MTPRQAKRLVKDRAIIRLTDPFGHTCKMRVTNYIDGNLEGEPIPVIDDDGVEWVGSPIVIYLHAICEWERVTP